MSALLVEEVERVTKLATEVFVLNAIPVMSFRFGLSVQRFSPQVVF